MVYLVCGISVEMDGSKDNLVHCIKPGSMAADVAASISAETATLFADSIRTTWTLISLPVMKSSSMTKLL